MAGKHVICPHCKLAVTVPGSKPELETATTETPTWDKPRHPATGSRKKLPQEKLPSIRKEVPRIAGRWIAAGIGVGVVLLAGLLLLPAVQRVNGRNPRMDSINNLKQIGWAFLAYQDTYKAYPTNGTSTSYLYMGHKVGGNAIAGECFTGSWAFQILPFIDQVPLFNSKETTVGLSVYMCSGRGRPWVSTTGAWTDYMLNSWINDPVNGLADVPDRKTTPQDITDGVSTTIFVGHGSIQTTRYGEKEAFAQSVDIFKGGHPALVRASTTNIQDSPTTDELTWGSPLKSGSLMALGDGSVRQFSYSRYSGGTIADGVAKGGGLAPFLTPAGGESVTLP
jgi:hypothetical protein